MPADRTPKKPQSARARMPAAHSLKGKVMKSLDGKDLQTTRALSQKLGLHQSSVSHTLKELMEDDLVVKKGKSYSLSNVGIIQKNTQELMGRTLRYLKDHRDFIRSHDLSGIPPGLQVTLGVVCDGLEITENDPAIPNGIQQKVILPLLTQARSFLVASSTLVPEHQLKVSQAVREGGRLQSVTTPRIIQELQLKNYILRDEALRGRTDLYCRSEINLHLIVTESHLFLALHRLDKTYDLENIIYQQGPAGFGVGQDALLLLPEQRREGRPLYVLRGRARRGAGRAERSDGSDGGPWIALSAAFLAKRRSNWPKSC